MWNRRIAGEKTHALEATAEREAAAAAGESVGCPQAGTEQFVRTVILGTAFFLAIGGHYAFKSYWGASIVVALGARGVPQLRVIEASVVLVAASTIFYSRWFHARLSFVIGGVAALGIAVLLTYPIIWPSHRFVSLLVLTLAGSVLNVASVYCLWMLFTSTVVSRLGRNITVFGAGAQLAMLASSSAAKAVSEAGYVSWLCISAGIAYLVAFAVIAYAMRRFSCYGSSAVSIVRPERAPRRTPLSALVELLRLSYLRLIAGVILVHLAFKAGLNWNVYKVAEQAETVDAASHMLATYYQYSSVACLMAQVVLVPLAFRFLTPRWGLFVLPLVGGACVAFVNIAELPTAIFLWLALFASTDFTVNNCMREALFVPMPLDLKVYGKSMLAMAVPTIGGLLAAAFVLGLSYMPQGMEVAAMIAILAVWLECVRRLSRMYSKVRRGQFDQRLSSVDEVGSEQL